MIWQVISYLHLLWTCREKSLCLTLNNMEFLFAEWWFLNFKRKSITVTFAWQLANFTYHVLTLTQLTLANISETGGIRSPNRGCRCLLLAPTCQPRWLEKWATENPRPHRQKHCRIRCVHVWRLYAKLKIGANFRKLFIAMSKLIHRLSTHRILSSLHETQGVHLSHPSQTPQPGRVTTSFWFFCFYLKDDPRAAQNLPHSLRSLKGFLEAVSL